jgi:hypothetical protein
LQGSSWLPKSAICVVVIAEETWQPCREWAIKVINWSSVFNFYDMFIFPISLISSVNASLAGLLLCFHEKFNLRSTR